MIEHLRKLCLFLLVFTGLFTLSGCDMEHRVDAYDSERCRSATIPAGLEIAKFDCVVTLTNATVSIEYKKKIESEDSTTQPIKTGR